MAERVQTVAKKPEAKRENKVSQIQKTELSICESENNLKKRGAGYAGKARKGNVSKIMPSSSLEISFPHQLPFLPYPLQQHTSRLIL